ncbi:DUF799 domain-containing protein [Acinetobacter puyangensis]|uniref:DUF799 domain-containing protein n=1 Tax=Acinetobacter puyangensis TaxID=1096779 RepID=UPI003A4DD57C
MKKMLCSTILLGIVLTGCATAPLTYDYSTYKANMPKSILVLPPINNTPDVKATYGYWTTVDQPVAEAGYYVFPMSIVDKMLKENGVTNGNDAQSIPTTKLREVFGADAALYIKVTEYGTKYQLIQSVTSVAAEAKLVDLRTNQVLWEGKQSIAQPTNNSGGNLIGMLASALIDQISSSLNDSAHTFSNALNYQLFTPYDKSNANSTISSRQSSGLLYGPRSPKYLQERP